MSQISQVSQERPPSKSPSQPPQPSLFSKLDHLLAEIYNDLKLKKKCSSSKIQKYLDRTQSLYSQLKQDQGKEEWLTMAGIYKDLGRMAQNQQCLERGIQCLRKGGGGPRGTVIRWTLQLTALKSQQQKHQESYQLAVKVTQWCQSLLQSILGQEGDDALNQKERLLVQLLLQICEQQPNHHQVLIFHADRSLQKKILSKLRSTSPSSLPLPFYPSIQFQIADIMTSQSCKPSWYTLSSPAALHQILAYLSTSYFTMATQKFYQKDYSFEYCHVKALKMGIVGFQIGCTYNGFLRKHLEDHFGGLKEIQEEKGGQGEHHDLMRVLPKDTKEVSLTHMPFCDQ